MGSALGTAWARPAGGAPTLICAVIQAIRDAEANTLFIPFLAYVPFKFNERKDELGDGGRFESVMKGCAGKRLTYSN